MRAAERLSRLPIFKAQDYLAANPDVAQAGVDAVEHALGRGAIEGRTLFGDTALARFYGRAARGDASTAAAGAASETRRLPRLTTFEAGPDGATEAARRCTVFVNSWSGEAYRETARDLAADLAGLGFDAALSDERADPTDDHGIAVFVAPHEFFALGLGPLWAEAGRLGEGFVVVDDPVESLEGGRSLGPLLRARGVIELSAVGAGIWSEAGIPTFHLRPRVRLRSRWLGATDLGHPLMHAAPVGARGPTCDPLGGDSRTIDLLYFGRESPRRNASLGGLAAALAPHRCFVYPQQNATSQAEERLRCDPHWRIFGHLSAQARLTLHLSEGRFPALERRRIVVQAMAGGSAVVTAARFAEPGLEAGTHYFHDDARHLGALIDWLLADPDGRRAVDRVRERAFDHIAAVNRDGSRLAGLSDFLLDQDGSDGRDRPNGPGGRKP